MSSATNDMPYPVSQDLQPNSFEYFEQTLIRQTGFREYDVRWLFPKDVNPNGFYTLARAYGTLLKESLEEQTAVVGHDFRQYSQELARSFILGLLSSGINVIDIGLSLTPIVYFAQHYCGHRGAAMITASHNENGWAGVKFANGLSSTLGPEGIWSLRQILENQRFVSGSGIYKHVSDMFQHYTEDLLTGGCVNSPFKVVVAAANGTAGHFAPTVLRRLGCEIIELDCDPDWNFSKHNPNPEDVSFLHAIKEATLANSADLGIGIDGDGDRLGVIDDKGNEVYSDKLGLLVARLLCPEYTGRKIVVDVKSTGLFFDDPLLARNGIDVLMCKTGHSYIKSAVGSANALAGFEKSGHWFFGQPIGRGYDDALLAAAVLIRLLDQTGRRLSELLAALPTTWQSPTLSPYCSDTSKYRVVDAVAATFEQDKNNGRQIGGQRIKEIVLINGVRFVLEDDSWGLVRASSNKPSLVVVVEARSSQRQMYEITADIQARLHATGEVGDYDQELPPLAVPLHQGEQH